MVAGYDSDLGDETERKSGYFDGPFHWQAIQNNCEFIIQFASVDDCLLPIELQRAVATNLKPKVKYIEFQDRDHFYFPPFNELISEIESIVSSKVNYQAWIFRAILLHILLVIFLNSLWKDVVSTTQNKTFRLAVTHFIIL